MAAEDHMVSSHYVSRTFGYGVVAKIICLVFLAGLAPFIPLLADFGLQKCSGMLMALHVGDCHLLR